MKNECLKAGKMNEKCQSGQKRNVYFMSEQKHAPQLMKYDSDWECDVPGSDQENKKEAHALKSKHINIYMIHESNKNGNMSN